MSLTDDEGFEVIFIPQEATETMTTNTTPSVPPLFLKEMRAIKLCLEEHTEAISLLRGAILDLKKMMPQ